MDVNRPSKNPPPIQTTSSALVLPPVVAPENADSVDASKSPAAIVVATPDSGVPLPSPGIGGFLAGFTREICAGIAEDLDRKSAEKIDSAKLLKKVLSKQAKCEATRLTPEGRATWVDALRKRATEKQPGLDLDAPGIFYPQTPGDVIVLSGVIMGLSGRLLFGNARPLQLLPALLVASEAQRPYVQAAVLGEIERYVQDTKKCRKLAAMVTLAEVIAAGPDEDGTPSLRTQAYRPQPTPEALHEALCDAISMGNLALLPTMLEHQRFDVVTALFETEALKRSLFQCLHDGGHRVHFTCLANFFPMQAWLPTVLRVEREPWASWDAFAPTQAARCDKKNEPEDGQPARLWTQEQKSALARFGLGVDASEADIRSAYRAAALKSHPDKNVGNEAAATKKFQDAVRDYDCLN